MARVALCAITLAGICVSSARAAAAGGGDALIEPITNIITYADYAAEKPDSDFTITVPLFVFNTMPNVSNVIVFVEIGKLNASGTDFETGIIFARTEQKVYIPLSTEGPLPLATTVDVKINGAYTTMRGDVVLPSDYTHYRVHLGIQEHGNPRSAYWSEQTAWEFKEGQAFPEYFKELGKSEYYPFDTVYDLSVSYTDKYLYALSGTFSQDYADYNQLYPGSAKPRRISTGIQPIPR